MTRVLHTFSLLPLLLVAMPGAPSSVLVTTSKALVTRSEALVPSSFLLLVAMPGAPSSFLFSYIPFHPKRNSPDSIAKTVTMTVAIAVRWPQSLQSPIVHSGRRWNLRRWAPC